MCLQLLISFELCYKCFLFLNWISDFGCAESSPRNGCGHFAGHGSRRSTSVRPCLWRISSLGKSQKFTLNIDIHTTFYFDHSRKPRDWISFYVCLACLSAKRKNELCEIATRSIVSSYYMWHYSLTSICQLNMNSAFVHLQRQLNQNQNRTRPKLRNAVRLSGRIKKRFQHGTFIFISFVLNYIAIEIWNRSGIVPKRGMYERCICWCKYSDDNIVNFPWTENSFWKTC